MADRWRFVVVVAVVLTLPLAALAQTKDDTLVYAVQSDLPNWDPPNSVLRESIIMGYHVFDHLAARDLKTGKVGPSLATSWRALDDTTWEIKLRTGVRFHDGTPFTARDVKASFDRVLDPEKKLTARGNHSKIKSVEVLDDHTVRFKTDGPYPLFAERLTALVMQSEKVMKDKGHEWMQENPIGTDPFKDRRVRQAANLAVDMDAIIKHVLNGLGDRTATAVNPMAFGFDPSLKPFTQDVDRAKKLMAEAGFANGFEVRFLQTAPIVEPALPQTSEAISSDLAKIGIKTRKHYIGDVNPFVSQVKDGKGGPMFEWSWGYYSIFDADAILFDVMTCGQAYSYYCNKAFDDLVNQGRSTLDPKKRAEIYAKAQKLIHDDAAYIFKWGLRGVWGVSNRVDYEAPRDEIDRMFVAKPRKK